MLVGDDHATHFLSFLHQVLPHFGSPCPTPRGILIAMKLRNRLLSSQTDHELIAFFGAARLVRTLAGGLELQGGTEAARKEARWWVRTFLRSPDDRRLPVAAER